MSSAVRNPDEQQEGGLTFLRPLPGVLPLPVKPLHEEQDHLLSVGDLSPSQLLKRLFPISADGNAPSWPSVTGLELGHFVIEERIGRGGMGAVFRALDRSLNRVVALKVLSPEQSADPASVQRFHNEARAAAQLDHNNIARVHYIGRDRGANFIAFEFVVGTTIRDLIVQRGRIAPADAVNFTLQIVEALRHTAAADVVHRDIKPSNIIVTPAGRAKLVDLGLARQSHSKEEDLTVAGTALGTFDYIAPEQAIDARNVDVRSDIYSLGCTLYHMLTGEPPFPKGSMFEKVMNHHRASPPDPRSRIPEVPAELGKIVQKMMASRPDERYATPEQLSQELSRIGLAMGMRPLPLDGPVWSNAPQYIGRPGWEGVQTWMAVGLLLLGLVVLIDKIPWEPQGIVPTSTEISSDNPWPPGPVNAPLATGNPAPANNSPDAAPRQRTSPEASLAIGVPVKGGDSASGPLAVLPISPLTDPPLATPSAPAGNTVPFHPPAQDPQSLINSVGQSVANSLNQLRTGIEELGVKVPPPMNSSASPQEDSGLTISVPPPEIKSPVATGGPATSSSIVPATPSPVESSNPQDLFHLLPAAGKAQSFSTLAEACFAADDGAIVELRFNGRLPRLQPPLRVTGKRLTVRPASGFRPVLTFALDTSVLPTEKGSAMISLGGGELDMYGIDLEMRVDARSVVDHWSIFSCSGASQLELVGVSLTIINPQQIPASFIEVPQREGAELAEAMPDKMYREPQEIRLLNSIVRGQGDLIIQENAEPLQMEMTDVAASITGAVLKLAGQDVFSMTMRDSEQSLAATFRHVTLIAGQGLLVADSGEQGAFLPVRLDMRDSVCAVLEPGQPLISFVGHEEFEDLQSRLNWANNRGSNFLELTGPVWRIRSPKSPFQDGQDYTLAQWNEYWGQPGDRQTSAPLFRAPRPLASDRMHRFDRADFLLRGTDATDNPALGAASDRRDAGVDWAQNQLPARFPELEPADRLP